MAEEKKTRGGKLLSSRKNLRNVKEGDIGRIVNESFQYFNRRPPKDNEECAERLNEFFAQCARDDQMPTVEDMALALGVTRKTVWEWETGVRRDPERQYMIQKAKEIIAGIDAKLAAEGKIPQVVYIFRAKNFHGMKDQQDVVFTPNQPLGEQADAHALQQKYLEAAEGAERVRLTMKD